MDIENKEPKLFWDTISAIAAEENVEIKNNRDLDDILEIVEYGSDKINKDQLQEKYKISIEHQHGGEGEGDDFHYVIKVQDKYFMIPGFWMSHEGSELYWDDVYECEPYKVEVTEWRKVS